MVEELSQRFPLLLQWDKRWGYIPYGDNVIGLSGCASTCLSMVIVGLMGNKEATPDAIAQYSKVRLNNFLSCGNVLPVVIY